MLKFSLKQLIFKKLHFSILGLFFEASDGERGFSPITTIFVIIFCQISVSQAFYSLVRIEQASKFLMPISQLLQRSQYFFTNALFPFHKVVCRPAETATFRALSSDGLTSVIDSFSRCTHCIVLMIPHCILLGMYLPSGKK